MYANSEELNMHDVINVQNIKKKLKISVKDIARAQNAAQEYDTEDEWMRVALKLPAGANVSEFIHSRLNEKEINTLQKFLKPGVL
jgi:hypothetical protein